MKILLITLLSASCSAFAQQPSPDLTNYTYPPDDCTKYDGTEFKTQCVLRNEEDAIVPNCSAGEFWKIYITTDSISDKKSCSIEPARDDRKHGGLLVFIDKERIGFTTLGQDYPGEPKHIRVDQNRAFEVSGGLSQKNSAVLLAQIQRGKMVKTQYSIWPYRWPEDRATPVCDLPEKVQRCKEAVGPHRASSAGP